MITSDYNERREIMVDRVLRFLVDCFDADPDAGSLPVQTVRSFLHQTSAQAWTLPILGILRRRGLIDLATGEDGKQVLYFTEAFRKVAAEGEDV